MVVSEKRQQASIVGDGFDHIMLLKKKCLFHRFPGHGGPRDKCYIFKMSTRGPGSGVDLVNRMQRTSNRDLSAAWVHFAHS